MRITLTSKLVAKKTNEGSSFNVGCNVFLDTSSDLWTASVPTTLRYRIDDPSCRRTVLDWTTVTPASTATITITGAQNAIYNQCQVSEPRELTAEINTGLSTQTRQTLKWDVVNISGIYP